jgi:ATP-binding cassette subfamily C (CFTR/MRP) protein 10
VYKYYATAIGVCLTTLTLLSLLLMQASRNLTDIWLSYWTQHHASLNSSINLSHLNDDANSSFFFTIYASLCAANSLFTLFRAFLFAYSGLLAARHIHDRLVTNLTRATLNFFQNTPSGRILNRLSSDLYAIDDSLPFILNIFLANTFGLVGMLAVTCYSLPWFALCLLPLSLVYYNIQSYYRWTSRELKRLSSISLSPVYTHFHETLTGLVTIRAFRKVRRFMDTNERLVSDYIRASYVNLAASQWLNFRLQMISVAMITMVGFSAVLQHLYGSADASLVGLALSYVLNVTGSLNGLVSSFTETEKEMVCVERAHQLERVESEEWQGVEEVGDDWPERACVKFENVTLRYKSDGLNALDEVSFCVRPGEKVGICGRTG